MKLLWTRRNTFGSKLIEWGTDGDCSHFAVVFDDKPGGYGIVFHSTTAIGVGLAWFGAFRQNYEIVHQMQPKYPINEEAVYQDLVGNFYGKSYDKLAFLYLGICLAGHKFFGRPLPVRNQWGNKDQFLCSEIYTALSQSGVIGLPELGDCGMLSPTKLHQIIVEKCPLWEPVDCSNEISKNLSSPA